MKYQLLNRTKPDEQSIKDWGYVQNLDQAYEWHKVYTPWLEDSEIEVLLKEYEEKWNQFKKLPESEVKKAQLFTKMRN